MVFGHLVYYIFKSCVHNLTEVKILSSKKDTGVNIRSDNIASHIKVELDELPLWTEVRTAAT